MEVKIGIQHSAREIVLESALTPDAVSQAITTALEAGGLLTLTDDKGRTVVVPGDKITYVELGSPERSRVGFGG